MDKSLSGEEVLEALNHKCNLIIYRDISNYSSLEELLGKYKACVILYEWRANYGHWTCIFEVRPGRVEFFDSLGYFIDDELKDAQQFYKGFIPYLSELLRQSPYKNIEYNEYELQKDSPKINTCGRHVIVRLKNKTKELYDYIKYLYSFGDNLDKIVTDMTRNI